MARLNPPVVTENTVEQIVGGPRDGWWKWTIGFQGDMDDPDLLTPTPTPNYPIGMTLSAKPDDEDTAIFGAGAPITLPIGVESAYRPWKPSGYGLGGNIFGSNILWRTETIVDGGDTDSGEDAQQSNGSGMLPYTLRSAGYDEPPAINWDISSVKPAAISRIGDVLYFPPESFPDYPMVNGWVMSARQYVVGDARGDTVWSRITNVFVHLRNGSGLTSTSYSDFIGGPLVLDPSDVLGPRDTTKLFNTLGVWQGGALDALSEVGSSGNSSVDGGVTFEAVEGQEYLIQVGHGVDGCNGSAVLGWRKNS